MTLEKARQGWLDTLNTMAPGAGISGATGELVKWWVEKDPVSKLIHTRGLIDVTGLASVATDGDIIGFGSTLPAYIGQIKAAVNGAIVAGRMSLFETPATGEVDIDLYAATEGTGKGDDAVGGLTETKIFDAAGDWGTVTQVRMAAAPAADSYLYLTVGTNSTPTAGTYTAGIYLIEFFGLPA